MSKPKPAKVKRAEVKTAGEGASECDSGPSHVSDSPAQNIFQCDNSVAAILGEEAILQWDGDGDEQFKASLRKAAGLPHGATVEGLEALQARQRSDHQHCDRNGATVEGLEALQELARLRLKRHGIAPNAPDYQKRLEAEIASLLRARARREEEKAKERRIRGEIERLSFELNMIHRHSEKPNARNTKPAARCRAFGKEVRAARLEKLSDPKQRSALISEHLRENGVEGASEDHRANVSIYLDGERDWLESTAHLTSKELDTNQGELKKKLQDLSGQLGSYRPKLADKLTLARWFNYQLADDIAKSEPLNDEEADDRDRLWRLLRLFGKSCALPENDPWMADVRRLRVVCRRDVETFEVLLCRMLCSFRMDCTSVYFQQPAQFKPGDLIHTPERFDSALAKLFWGITDPKKLQERERKLKKHRRSVEKWERDCDRIKATPPRDVWAPKPPLPPRPRMEEEIESERLDTVEDRRRRGWSWFQIAEELVNLGLETIADLGGPETDSGLKEELRRDELGRLEQRLKTEFHRLLKSGD
jgi:hypothetical protein